MKKFILAITIAAITNTVLAATAPYRVKNTLQTRDSDGQVIGNVFEKGGDFLLVFNGTGLTSSDLIKRAIGEPSLTNGDSIVIRVVTNGECLFDLAPSPDVTASNGTLLPNEVVEFYRVKTNDKIGARGRGGAGQINVTRVK
jgi:hypothetical protein